MWKCVVCLLLFSGGVVAAPRLPVERLVETNDDKLKREDPILWASSQPVENKPWRHLRGLTRKMANDDAIAFNKANGLRLTELIRNRVTHKDGWVTVFEVDTEIYPDSLAVVLFILLMTDGDEKLANVVDWTQY